MTAADPSFASPKRLNRIFSFGSILALGAALTVARIAILITGLDLPGLPTISAGTTEFSSGAAVELAGSKEGASIPWPGELPEPAAGPEDAMAIDGEAGSQTSGDEGVASDPSSLTEGEKIALQQLAARSQMLDERERLLDIRAELNGRTEARLDEQIKVLEQLKGRIEELTKTLDEAEELKLARLVKIYETMKPKAAAEIFNRLGIQVLLHVIERMREAKSAAVIAKMDPAIARRITTELARKKERPTLNGQT